MDWWKLFSGTFFLIFLAELGDKTQLAALAKTADSPDSSMAKWIVFLGASLALVASTFIAVFLGHFLKTIIPDERYIRLAAAVLFLIFGCSILYEVYSSFRKDKAPAAIESPAPTAKGAAREDPGLVGGLALAAAMDFETLAAERYRRLAKNAPPDLAGLLLELAEEETGHFNRLARIPDEMRDACRWDQSCRRHGISGRSIAGDKQGEKLVRELADHEEATALFYQDLAGRTLIPSVRTVFLTLADEERGHARRLREVLST